MGSPTAQTWPQFVRQLSAVGWDSPDLRLSKTAFDMAAVLFAASERGEGKPFIDHLVGTASGVLLGEGEPEVVAAALLHAAYDMGDFGDLRRGPHPRHRRRLRDAVGDEAEELVYRYHRLGWGPDVAQATLRSVEDASAHDRSVALIRVANEIDDGLDGALMISGKDTLPEHARPTHEAVAVIAERVGNPALGHLARTVLLEQSHGAPPELIVGLMGGHLRLPESATLRARFQMKEAARRVMGPRARAQAKRLLRSVGRG